ncbi:type II secretion system minor pseudopilin GspI [Sphingomonas sp.]|jgi:general secretion pathway protein I|uniref:type II secretion system minor pseudopilin GspI n=1 Tax=Sphingomonas sp. TaxID=28214 RepID=UPI002ED92CBF
MARSRGFTLIEVMVALVVFSLVAMALMRLQGATIRGAATLDTTIAAQMVARTVATDAVTQAQPPVVGRSDGRGPNGGRDWNWTRRVSGTGDARIVRIDVAVTDRTGQIVAQATAVRPATTAP